MIIIKIKTPKDYWKQLKERLRQPRQEVLKDIAEYTLRELRKEAKKKFYIIKKATHLEKQTIT